MAPRTLKFPEPDAVGTAIEWLRSNEGYQVDEGSPGSPTEAARCAAVADYLEALERDRLIKAAARKAGVPVAAARAKLNGR